ncbi:intraflagellar transport protein 80 homolog isoform X2 [Cryptotermes secundus]|uniref:intraflagellar transport protein 80 homolog isoform X2 n=1 Tax=Cryptotermes secundus TaxID=105785 RepID=UPI001454D24B|nr:intraflagellar transport protein 80 homolog isoform X2 [Cryptotermes secundus]
MRFKTSLLKEPKHSDLVGCVAWNNTEEVYSCGDDHTILKWNLVTKETVKVADMPSELYPTDLHWFPRCQVAGKKQGQDILLVTAADGKFHLISKNGRIEKSVDAHQGAALTGRWSYDGAGLLTAGEDGQVKIWSRSGMLRSTIVQSDTPIYSAAWGPDSNQVLHTSGKMLIIKHLTPNSKPNKWRAHDGLILKVAWNPSNNLIISGGEDCRYRWSYSLEKPTTGSIFNITWSSDGTQVAGACGNGHVIFAHIIERRLEWKNYEVTVTGRKSISVQNVSNDAWEKLEFPDRIIKVSLGYNHLVVVTSSQCHIYTTKNWNTPVIFDLREGSVCMLLLAERHFLLVEKSSLSLYSYEGRLLCSPRWQGMQPETFNPACVSISPDTIAVRDQTDEKLVHLFELGTARSLVDAPPIRHGGGVVEIALNQAGSPGERQLVLVDKNRDMYLTNIRGSATLKRLCKLGSMIQSLCWNNDTNMLAAVQDTNLIVWYYPTVLYVDKRLVKKTVSHRDASEFGKNPVVVSFDGNHLGVRRVDGSLVTSSVSPYPSVLHGYAASSRWDDALRLCRFIKDSTLWACLAAMSTHAKDLTTAEEAYAAIDETDKVAYIQHIKANPLRTVQLAEMALLGGNIQDAESILLQNGLVFRSIFTNLHLHNWNRALELAIKHKTHVDTVLFFRKKYLETFDKPETNLQFLQFKNKVELDAEKIAHKIEMEYQKELQNG